MAHSKVFFESLFKVMYSILFNVKTGKGERMIGNVKKTILCICKMTSGHL